jgi:hypothetical protein
VSESIVLNLPSDVPDYLKSPVIFYDRNYGVSMIAEWEGVKWLFVRINDNWVSKRKIGTQDYAALDVLKPIREG